MSTLTSYSRRIVTAAAGIGVLGAGMATSAFAAPAVPNASDAPVPIVTRPVDASGGLLGIPRGSLPGLATPDLEQVPMAAQLPQLEIVPLPEADASPQTATTADPASSETADAPAAAPATETAAPQRTSGGSALAGLDDAGFMSGLTRAVPAG